MFSKQLCIAFLTLALSSFTAKAAPHNFQQQPGCNAPSTVFKTVTVTASSSAAAITLNNGSGKGNTVTTKSTSSTTAANNGKGGNVEQTKTTTTKSTTTTAANNGGGKGGNGGKSTTTTSAAATVTSAVNNNGGKGNKGGNNNGDPQTSLTLDPLVIASGFANDGQDVPAAGQVKSLTSTNNFINFCRTVPNLPITNGKQITTGSCNPAPIGIIPSVDNMPSSKFVFPTNFGTVKANTAFTIKMAIQNMQTGFFVNAQENYFAAPQQLNGQGQIEGHSHVVVELLDSLKQTKATDPKKFAFFKGLNAAASGGVLTADVTAGLPIGTYRLASINTAANHQPVIVPIAQHGSLDDAIYFTVTADGKPGLGSVPPAVSATAGSGAGKAASTSVAATVSGTKATTSAKAAQPTVKGGAAPANQAGAATPTGKTTVTPAGKTTLTPAGKAGASVAPAPTPANKNGTPKLAVPPAPSTPASGKGNAKA